MLIGRKPYEMINGLPAEVRDEGWLFSRTLKGTDWPGLEIVHDDLVGFVREQKRTDVASDPRQPVAGPAAAHGWTGGPPQTRHLSPGSPANRR